MENSNALIPLVSQVAQIEQMLIEGGGEANEELESALAIRLDEQLPSKVQSYDFIIQRMAANAAFYRQQADFYLKLAKSHESIVDRCQNNLIAAMQILGVNELAGPDVKFKLSRSAKTNIQNEELIDENYKKVVTETKIDRKRILDDLKAGLPVAGACLEETLSVRRYANSPRNRKKAANE